MPVITTQLGHVASSLRAPRKPNVPTRARHSCIMASAQPNPDVGNSISRRAGLLGTAGIVCHLYKMHKQPHTCATHTSWATHRWAVVGNVGAGDPPRHGCPIIHRGGQPFLLSEIRSTQANAGVCFLCVSMHPCLFTHTLCFIIPITCV